MSETDEPVKEEPDCEVTVKEEVPEEVVNVPPVHHCAVDELLGKPYGSRDFSRTSELIEAGRPTPPVTIVSDRRDGEPKKILKDSHYTKVEWLTACDSLAKLFCWPCLLFDPAAGSWNRTGFRDLYNFSRSSLRHENSRGHILASMHLVAFHMSRGNGRVADNAEERNESVRRHKECLARMVEAVGATGGACMSPVDNRLLLKLVRRTESPLDRVPDLHRAVLNSIDDSFLECLAESMDECPYVAVVLDETRCGRVAVVLRYSTSRGRLRDTFVGFYPGDDLCAIVAKVEKDFKIDNKLVAILLGALTRPETLCGYAKAILFHSPSHLMSQVLPRTLHHLTECAAFFHVIRCFEQWLRDARVRQEIEARLPHSNVAKWIERPVTALHEHRETVRDLVHHVLDKPTAWHSSAYSRASALRHALRDLEFSFLLKVFHELLPLTDYLLEVVLNNTPNLKVCKETVDDYVKVLNWKKEKFDELWESVQDIDLEGSAAKRPRHVGSSRLVTYYRSLYETIVDGVVRQVEMRLGGIKYIGFTELLCNKMNFLISDDIEKWVLQLRVRHEEFESIRLKNELMVAYSQVDFKGLQCDRLLRHLYETGLSGPLRQVTRLARLLLVLPFACSVDNEPAKRLFVDIHAFSRLARSHPPLSPFALVHIENRLLNSFIDTCSLVNKADRNFAEAHPNMDLTLYQQKRL